jgi:hypothetical protein
VLWEEAACVFDGEEDSKWCGGWLWKYEGARRCFHAVGALLKRLQKNKGLRRWVLRCRGVAEGVAEVCGLELVGLCDEVLRERLRNSSRARRNYQNQSLTLRSVKKGHSARVPLSL